MRSLLPRLLQRSMEAHHAQATAIRRSGDFCISSVTETRKLAAILVSDVVGYSGLAGADEDRILARLRTLRSDLMGDGVNIAARLEGVAQAWGICLSEDAFRQEADRRSGSRHFLQRCQYLGRARWPPSTSAGRQAGNDPARRASKPSIDGLLTWRAKAGFWQSEAGPAARIGLLSSASVPTHRLPSPRPKPSIPLGFGGAFFLPEPSEPEPKPAEAAPKRRSWRLWRRAG
jgi:hypothetical protein